jgi:hypothetical protein
MSGTNCATATVPQANRSAILCAMCRRLRNVQAALPPGVNRIYGRAVSGIYCREAAEAYEKINAEVYAAVRGVGGIRRGRAAKTWLSVVSGIHADRARIARSLAKPTGSSERSAVVQERAWTCRKSGVPKGTLFEHCGANRSSSKNVRCSNYRPAGRSHLRRVRTVRPAMRFCIPIDPDRGDKSAAVAAAPPRLRPPDIAVPVYAPNCVA